MRGGLTHGRAAGPAIVMVATTLAGAACSTTDEPVDAAPDFPVVFVAEARIETLRDSFVGMGRAVTATAADWTVIAPQPARIVSISKAVGDAVESGEPLVVFEIGTLARNIEDRELARTRAVARIDTARSEAARLSALYEQGIIARNQHETAQAELRTAEAALLSAEAYLAEARLLAEQANVAARFSGVVTDVWHVEGDFVTPDPLDPILRVIDPTRIEISVPVPVEHLGRLVEGKIADVQPLGIETIATATVSQRRPPPDPDSTTAEIRLRPDDPSGLALEMAVRVEFLLEERPDVVVVPVSALLRDTTSSFVMIAGDDGRAWRRDISVGLVTADRAEIVEGVAPGEAVITSGGEGLLEGEPVTIAG